MNSIDKNNIYLCIKIQNPGLFLVKNESYIFNEETKTYQVLFHLTDINDKYIRIVNTTKLNLQIPMKQKGNNITVVIDADLTKKNPQTNIIDCPFYIKVF